MIEFKKPKELIFLPVTGLDMQQIANHVERFSTPDAEIEFVDLTGIFNDVDASFETQIDKLQPIMNVKKAIDFEKDGVPNEVRFVVPSTDLPASDDEKLMDLGFTMVRYAYIDAMPKELQGVVRAYLSLRNEGDTIAQWRFKEAVATLAQKTIDTFGDPDGV